MGSAMWPGGNGNYRLETYLSVNGRDVVQIVGVRRLGGTGFYANSRQPWSVLIAGAPDSGSWLYDFRNGVTYIEVTRHTVGGAAFGAQSATATVTMDFGSRYGGRQTISVTDYFTIANVPAAPSPIALDEAGLTSLRFRFSGNSDNGSPILEWQAQIARDAGFTQGVQTVGSGGTTVFSGLQAGTTHYARARGRNAIGWGPWSAAVSGTTLPAGAPGMTVRPSPDSLSAFVQLSPPGGSSGVTRYDIEYRKVSGGSTTALSTTVATLVVTPLVIGETYEWRARAAFGSYDSPWSTWQAVTQTPPVANANAYFDGSQGGSGARAYSWAGTPHASPSVAKTSTPLGWEVVNSSGSGSVALRRIVGGTFGSFGVRATAVTDLGGDGLEVGPASSAAARSAVLGDVTYAASIYARPSRSQRIAARVYWYKADGGLIGYADGGAVVTGPNEFVRLSVIGTTPLAAAYATVRVVDVTGAGWSVWKANEYIDADGAMITLRHLYAYFDGSFIGTQQYSYSWDGTPHASPSTRTLLPEQVYVIADPDCASIPGAPQPPAIVNDCVVTEGQWRRFWYAIPAIEIGEWTETLPTIIINSASSDIGQVRVRFYRNPDSLPAEQYDSSVWEGELILSYVPPLARVTLDAITQRATVDVDGRTGVAADHLLYGTDGGVVTWPTLSCGDAYLMSWDIPVSTPSGNVSVELELTQRM